MIELIKQHSSLLPRSVILEFDIILEATKAAGATRAMIGGGAIRDRLLGKPVVDTDVFYEGEVNPGLLLGLLKRRYTTSAGNEPRANFSPPVDHAGYDIKVESILDVWGLISNGKDIRLQFMKVKSIDHRFEHFAANISKVFYEEGQLYTTHEFHNAVKHKHILLEHYASPYYYYKMKDKFREYKVEYAPASFSPRPSADGWLE